MERIPQSTLAEIVIDSICDGQHWNKDAQLWELDPQTAKASAIRRIGEYWTSRYPDEAMLSEREG